MKVFKFKQFSIQQSSEVFRVGTDGVLLGAMCDCEQAKRILEVGTGTGLIAMMLAQRNANSEITAIDINSEAVELAKQNVDNSPFDSIRVECQNYVDYLSQSKFDLIVSNPPYFEINSSSKDILARQQLTLTYRDLVRKSAENLDENGIFSVIIPSDHFGVFVDYAAENKLHLKRKVNIFGIKDGELRRVLLEFSFLSNEVVEENFIIEKAPRQYSEQYFNLTKDFHVFSNK